jgi:hypothetical protein
MKKSKRVYIFDIDDTICDSAVTHKTFHFYKDDEIIPNQDMVKTINILYDKGHTIILLTGRGSVTGIDWSKETKRQLEKWGLKYHELRFVKKPLDYLYVDDKACSPEEFWHRVEEDL